MPRKSKKKAANNLRAWREFVGLSQDELGARVGTAGNVIGMLESGERKLSFDWLKRLAPELGTTPGFILDHEPDDRDAAFLRTAMAVPAEKRAQAADILRTFGATGTEG